MFAALAALVLLAQAGKTPEPSVRLDTADKAFEIGATKSPDDRTAVTHALEERLGAARTCWAGEIAHHPKLHGTVVFVFSVLPDGSVSRPVVNKDSVNDQSLTDCVIHSLRALTVPFQDQTVRVVVPLVFSSGNEPAPDPKASGTPAGDDGQAELDAFLLSERADIDYCWKKFAEKDPGIAGSVVVDFTVEDNGTVRTASIGGGTLASHAVKQCLVGLFKKWHFPPPAGGRVQVERSYSFPPQAAKPAQTAPASKTQTTR